MRSTPFQVETVEAMRDRYPAALKKVWDLLDLQKLVKDPNWQKPRENLFDFEDGIRVCISVEFDPTSPKYQSSLLHVSGTVELGSKMHKRIENGYLDDAFHFSRIVRRKFKSVAGFELPEKVMVDKSSVPHWWLPMIMVPRPS